MLGFFRKYQRFIFIIVTVVIVVSFTFFGTYNAYSQRQEAPDHMVVKGIDGSDLMHREISALCRLIATSPLDRMAQQKGQTPNLLNDSVIEKDLIASGMAMMLARRYFEELKPDLEAKLARIKSYRPYSHPQKPEISAQAIWNRFLPSMNQHLALLKFKSDQFTPETLGVLFQLYLDQAMLPPDFLKHVLKEEVNRLGIDPDPVLAHGDLSLFGFHGLEDWFGPRFVELTSQFLINVGRVAKKRGYHFSNETVRSELYHNIATHYQELNRQEKMTAQDVDAYYQAQIQLLGGDEQQLLDGWRHVMLFRQLFQDVGNSVFIDRLPFEQFHQYTRQACKVDLYELPSHLQLKNLFDVCKLQIYLDAVSLDHAERKNNLSLSDRFAPMGQIEKKFPELVEQQVEVEYALVQREDLIRKISLKQTWDWEVEDRSWELLKKQFPQLAAAQGTRAQILDRLDPQTRLRVDVFAQSMMLDQHPERISSALGLSEMRRASFGLRGAGKLGPFDSIKDKRRFVELIRSAALHSPEAPSMITYSDDQQTFYRIALLSRSEEKKILSFAEAQRDGTLDQMLDKRLESAYPDVRRKAGAIFQQTDGSWKPLKEVREKVARVVFADLLKAIENSVETPAAKSEELPAFFYCQYRLYGFLNEVKKQLEAHPEDLRWVQADGEQEPSLKTQWKIVKTEQVIARNSDFSFAKEQMFKIPVNGWSEVEPGSLGSLAFYRVLGTEQLQEFAAGEMSQGHHLLSLDAQRTLLSDLLTKMEAKKAISLTKDGI